MKLASLLLLLAAAAVHRPAVAATGAPDVPLLPFDDVRAGMTGVGRTVFQGTEVVEFAVEILGKVPNVGPDQDLILARLSGGPLADTGVLAGMSGSPVLVDGRLVGAVAYTWGFSKEPIAGITPIAEILAVETGTAPAPARAGRFAPTGDPLRTLDSPQAIRRFFEQDLVDALSRPAGALPISVPLSVGGLGAAGVGRVGRDLGPAGFVAIQAGGSGSRTAAAPPLVPGSPVGIKLVRGDVEMTATGTVTWVDGDRVWAFGHPLFSLGDVDLPLTGASVLTLLPSLMQSSRIAVPLGEVGALRQDRASGVFGRLGARPAMIPVRFQLVHAERPARVYSFDVADDPLLSPLLLYASLQGILATHERPFGQATVRVREGSVIKLAGVDDVELDNLFAGSSAFDYGTGLPAFVLYLLMNNVWSRPEVAGVNLILEVDDVPRTARIQRAVLDRYRVHAGDEVEASVVVRPFRGRDEVHTRKFRIPEETAPGILTIDVGGAYAIHESEQTSEPVLPRDLEQLVRLINQLRRNDRIYIAATREDSGVLLDGSRLPNLPPSASTVLHRPRSRGGIARTPLRSLLEEAIPTDWTIEGTARVELEVLAP